MDPVGDGYRVGLQRLPIALNPHDDGTAESGDWARGWHAATHDLAVTANAGIRARMNDDPRDTLIAEEQALQREAA